MIVIDYIVTIKKTCMSTTGVVPSRRFLVAGDSDSLKNNKNYNVNNIKRLT